MTETHYAHGVTAEGLRIFLDFWPSFSAEGEDVRQMLISDKELFFGKDSIPFSWCYLYELPIQSHVAVPLIGFLEDEKFKEILKGFKEAPNKLAVIPELSQVVDAYLDTLEMPSKDEALEMLPILAGVLGVGFSIINTLRCVLYHGCFLNELIERVSHGDDKALFDAVRIDPTVIGCKSVIARVSKATLLQEVQFFSKLKAALTGKIAKREQVNFQKMRLVFEVLHEAGATRLSDEQLHSLFVEELKLYSGGVKSGGNAKALRKFADTYMKRSTTT